MAGAAKTPAPIDRPLSRAYLREFGGWAPEHPPGVSDPTSLRVMENLYIKNKAAAVRPGLRYLTYEATPTPEAPGGEVISNPVVGSHEAFFLTGGIKAYLFAVREDDQTVGFRVLRFDAAATTVQTLAEAGFALPDGEPAMRFTAATTYVKYLQIDNQVFALSNAGEPMRLFQVGEIKIAKRINKIEKPEWKQDDTSSVVHPDATWIEGGAALSTRVNALKNPSLSGAAWSPDPFTLRDTVTAPALYGGASTRLRSKYTYKNYLRNPLRDVAANGIGEWFADNASAISADGDWLKVTRSNPSSSWYVTRSSLMTDVVVGEVLQLNFVLRYAVAGNVMTVVRFHNAAGATVTEYFDYTSGAAGVKTLPQHAVPVGAVSAHVYVGEASQGNVYGGALTGEIQISQINLFYGAGAFDGDSGTNYFWTGTPHASSSVYHPPQTAILRQKVSPVSGGEAVRGSVYARSSVGGVSAQLQLGSLNASGVHQSASTTTEALSTSSWTRLDRSHTNAVTGSQVEVRILVNLAYGQEIYVDGALFEYGSGALGDYFDGDTLNTPTWRYTWVGGDALTGTSVATEYSGVIDIPDPETPAGDTLISSVAADNDYNFAFFYTFYNEVGESQASMITQTRVKRPWTSWKWNQPDSIGEPTGPLTSDPALVADQLVVILPEAAYTTAVAQGAKGWRLYALTWSDDDSVPVDALLVATTEIKADSTYETAAWARVTAASANMNDQSMGLPNELNLYNYSDPARAGNGLVVADRMVLVYDPAAAAVIRWSSNEQGSYTDFTANRGGGYKTLTSGNMFVPAAVKLWQNPQSADTIIILCLGVDGHNTGYYMAPAQVSQQSETVTVMSFEETTATPGTSSPFGCEVLNNALYHPLDEAIVKSTASNYNISHRTITDMIEHKWRGLLDKSKVVSSSLQNKLYYIVNNPEGAPLEAGCWGNEIWVYDAAETEGSWSRYLIQAQSLRKIGQNGKVYMSVVRPDGIFYLDDRYAYDDYVTEDGTVAQRSIPWRLETNTQGANRAHDAWARLQGITANFGNFAGTMRWGIRSWDVNGQEVQVEKIYRQLSVYEGGDTLPFDVEDQLQIRRDLKEWFFYAESVEEDGEVLHSEGQINTLQYRYAPVTVNVGYEYGSIETFEYGRATENWAQRTTDAGVPQPMLDQRRP